MSEERKQVLKLLAEGKINADEAERLLAAMETGTATEEKQDDCDCGCDDPKYMCIQVNCDPEKQNGRENVNIKVPIMLLKTGMKFKSLMPEKARVKIMGHMSAKGLDFDLDNLDSAKLDEVIKTLCETSIDIDTDKEKVKIFCC